MPAPQSRNRTVSAGVLILGMLAGVSAMTAEHGALAKNVESKAYVLDVTFDQPIETVWAAITKKELIDKYYFSPVNADVTQVGAEIFYGPAAHKLILGKVLALDAPSLFKHSFRFAEEADTSETTVIYTLSSEAKGTRLHIEHQGYAANSQGYADIEGGWPVIAGGLKAVLEKM